MAGLPTGTVTFLFTDIEGSTARWEHQPEAMRAALARHDALVRAAIVEHGGHVVKTMGDAFHAAFSRAPDAIAAALDAQYSLQAEPWGEIGPLRVRMSLHTGVAEERDGDYFGPALNRAARILSGGHGGQVLLSLVTSELVRDVLPKDVTLLDLGEHRLKDLIRPERVFQVVALDLPSEFPPLICLDARPNNLPVQPTPLVGRDDEIAAARQRLVREDVRLLTLTGPGGTGKTRLALQVAAELIDHFGDGAVFVGLAPIRDPDLVASTIGQALGIHDLGNRPILDSLRAYLHERHLLLLLDNFEQILPAAPVVAELLSSCPGLKVLVTSRAPLHLRGEQELPVSPLAFPEPGSRVLASTVATWPSVALFVQRAADVRPDFTLTDETAALVAEICRRVDGLPLALELAAARVKMLSPEAMLTRLERRLPLLTGGARDLPERQRTLRDTIDWSYELLDEAEQRLFRRLAVFVGGSTLEAIEAVCDSDAAVGLDVLDGVASLVDKSLVRQIDGPDHEPRFTMLETVREFAADRLVASGEEHVIRCWHAEHYLRFVETARPQLRGPMARLWLDRIEVDHENLRAAIAWGEAPVGRPDQGSDPSEDTAGLEVATRVAKACAWYWMLRGHLIQGRQIVNRLLERAPNGTSAHARALLVAGGLANYVGDGAIALRLAEEGLAEWRALGDARYIALALARKGEALGIFGALDRARAAVGESEMLAGDSRFQEDLEHPLVQLLTRAAWLGGELETASAYAEQSLALGRADGDLHTTLSALRYLALVAQRRGQIDHARRLHTEALHHAHQLGDYACTMHAFAGLAFTSFEAGNVGRAARLLAIASRLRDVTGMVLSAYSSAGSFEQSMTAARSVLGDSDFDAAWSEGRAMRLDEAVRYALEATA
ncbi:MAG: adenylate/guanylate cyclase domain-containing protein [Chloroflexi bacterium]|nr:adenylate/guanylate cyclase domain-containing protein [Chloroflexota bacterium]